LIKILVISGSPTAESSTDILLKTTAEAVVQGLGGSSYGQVDFVKLNDFQFIPCQSCGKAPHDEWCVFHDAISPVLDKIAECDCLIVGSPIYFDSVSAQLKALMDRCNCFRPANFDGKEPGQDFVRLIKRKRPGAIILVGGEQGWFEGARRSIAGFFIWIEVTNEGMVQYHSKDFKRTGEVIDSGATLEQARAMGSKLAETLRKSHD